MKKLKLLSALVVLAGLAFPPAAVAGKSWSGAQVRLGEVAAAKPFGCGINCR